MLTRTNVYVADRRAGVKLVDIPAGTFFTGFVKDKAGTYVRVGPVIIDFDRLGDLPIYFENDDRCEAFHALTHVELVVHE